MDTSSTTIRTLLVFLASAIAALAVVDPVGMPEWLQVAVAALSAGFAGVGILPPQYGSRRVPPDA